MVASSFGGSGGGRACGVVATFKNGRMGRRNKRVIMKKAPGGSRLATVEKRVMTTFTHVITTAADKRLVERRKRCAQQAALKQKNSNKDPNELLLAPHDNSQSAPNILAGEVVFTITKPSYAEDQRRSPMETVVSSSAAGILKEDECNIRVVGVAQGEYIAGTNASGSNVLATIARGGYTIPNTGTFPINAGDVVCWAPPRMTSDGTAEVRMKGQSAGHAPLALVPERHMVGGSGTQYTDLHNATFGHACFRGRGDNEMAYSGTGRTIVGRIHAIVQSVIPLCNGALVVKDDTGAASFEDDVKNAYDNLHDVGEQAVFLERISTISECPVEDVRDMFQGLIEMYAKQLNATDNGDGDAMLSALQTKNLLSKDDEDSVDGFVARMAARDLGPLLLFKVQKELTDFFKCRRVCTAVTGAHSGKNFDAIIGS